MDNSGDKLFIPSECLTSVCQIQSNLIQVVNSYLERLGKQTDIQAVHLYSVLESCSLLLGVVPSLAQPISVFLSSIENPFSHWLCANDLKGWTVLFHLLPYVLNEVRMAWNWESIFKFLSCENIRVRYFASQIVCLLLNKTENERNQMESLLGVDRGSCYQSTALMELKKEELLYKEMITEKRREYLKRYGDMEEMQVEPKEGMESERYVEICGYILRCRDGERSASPPHPFVLTEVSRSNLQHLCLQMQHSAPILLQGVAGCGKTRLFQELAHQTNNDDYVQLYLDDQMDSKTLIGNYVCTDVPGEFVFQPGTLTQCITTGRWIIIEDIDKVPFDIVSTLLPIIEKGELSIPSRGITLKVHPNFRLFGTSCHDCSVSNSPINSFLSNHWNIVDVANMTVEDIRTIIDERFGNLLDCIREKIVATYQVLSMADTSSSSNEAVIAILEELSHFSVPVTPTDLSVLKSELLRNGKPVTCRDVLKWCKRLSSQPSVTQIANGNLSEKTRKLILDDALDVFAGCLPEGRGRTILSHIIAAVWDLSSSVVDTYTSTAPPFDLEENVLKIGRVQMPLAKDGRRNRPFYKTKQALRLMQQICVCINSQEPMLLVGETGCGKTTVIQYIAELVGQELVVLNMNEQTQCSDLVGGFKPVDLRQLAIPLYNRCCELFNLLFTDNKHPTFKPSLKEAMDSKNYLRLANRLAHFVSFAAQKIEKAKKQSLAKNMSVEKYDRWLSVLSGFLQSVQTFEKKVHQVEDSFAFSFVPGALVEAIEKGKWVLLDELNLAPGEVLQRLSGLLESVTSSLILSERGDVTPIKRHPNFRIFAAMNPATDVGKKSLAPSVRNRFSEFYVDELTDRADLELIVRSSLENCSMSDVSIAGKIVDFYLQARAKAETSLVDGGNRSPRYSLRTLCRALEFVNGAGNMKLSFRVALYEGLCMAFMTMLDLPSQAIMKKLIQDVVFFGGDVVSAYPSRNPGGTNSHKEEFVLVNKYWIRKGAFPCVDLSQPTKDSPPRFILTESVKHRLDDLCRAVLMEKCPVLLQGPTSSGKTSMITYLAALTGHKCVRINNHEYTDLQDYTGIYISAPNGQLVFHEGLLVEALRNGYWVILDELNLAPSEVLEALNRLLDDNRELYIPETNTIVRPHPQFMLFATQNPPGKYGGRKVLSRAFRNRFLEMHVEDLPPEELQIIIEKRSGVCTRFAKEMITVMQRLQIERQNSNVFAGKDGYITPRDLLRWGNRRPASSEELAYHGYMLLAERLRRDDERLRVKSVIEEVCKVKLDLNAFYLNDEIIDRMMDPSPSAFSRPNPSNQSAQLWNLRTLQSLQEQIHREYLQSETAIPSGLKSIAITGTLQKMFKLIGLCLHYNEPVLLVGGTGCGKTTAVQLVAQALHQHLVILNCHAHTETSDILGGQRPSRSHDADAVLFKQSVLQYIQMVGSQLTYPEDVSLASLEEARAWLLNESPSFIMSWLGPQLQARDEAMSDEERALVQAIREAFGRYQTIFTWQDGPLLSTMKHGDIFLLDEISLAEDAVLERMNSILESERQITVPEKGGDCIEVITAHEKFRILATMNPGGDFGKKELSAALRNRFTEIWVSPLNGLEDLRQIMKDRIQMKERGNVRFAEVSDEIHQRMVECLLPFVDVILAFIDFYNQILNENTSSMQNRTEATCRDILSIIDFMKLAICHLDMSPYVAFVESINMILLDGLGIGTNMSSTMSTEYKQRCYSKILELIPASNQSEVDQFFQIKNQIQLDGSRFGVPPYSIAMSPSSSSSCDLSDYHFAAPTTASNLRRVMRALQLHKPILLEGSPGVGKTSLIMAIAQVIGQKIVRINLSEQTDMADLLGSDLPIPVEEQSLDESGNAVQFRWSDGVLLSGIKSGAWILLDELNLASQQVLEGLNSCLDHRATVYIPEIDKEFQCPPSFQIFACQNPLEEGGGRKGLPRSFINRFARVYVDTLKQDDMLLISKQLMMKKIEQYYGSDNPLLACESVWSMLEKMVTFVIRLDEVQNVGRAKNVNSFEFNLRDVFRWCDLMLANQSIAEFHPEVFLDMLFIQRMRDARQQQHVLDLFNEVFQTSFVPAQFPLVHLTDHSVKIGNALVHRINSSQSTLHQPLLRGSLRYLESLLFAVENKLPCLLVGESGSGKSYSLQALSSLLNVRLHEYNMNTTTDATEILGCFEQVEVSRHYSRLLGELVEILEKFLWRALISNCSAANPAQDFSNKRLRVNSIGDTRYSIDQSESEGIAEGHKRSREVTPRIGAMLPSELVSALHSFISYLNQQVMALVDGGSDNGVDIDSVLNRCEETLSKLFASCEEDYVDEMKSLLKPANEVLLAIQAIKRASKHVAFEWIDGSLIEAIVRGHWVVFDNVNFCNASVLDRLNSLLENNGFLLINECGLVDGKERIIYPHNNFRIFFVMNPSFGEISRAMRNRCVELYFSTPSTLSVQNIPALWDAFDLVNSKKVNDLLLVVVLLLPVYADLVRVVALSMVKLNARYLSRFATLAIEQLERGKTPRESLEVAATNTFPLASVKEYLGSEEFEKRIANYHRIGSFCAKHGIESRFFLDDWKTSLANLCNEASDLQMIREAFLLHILIRLEAHSQLSSETLNEWMQLIEEGLEDEQRQLLKPLQFFLKRAPQETSLILNVVCVYLVFMRSQPNLNQIEVFLSPAVCDAATAETAGKILSMVKEALYIVRSSPFYQQFKAAQSTVRSFVEQTPTSLPVAHIPLFSNNFDESMLCTATELMDHLPLFISLQDPLLVRLRKRVINQGLLARSEEYRSVLAELDTAISRMNRYIYLVPLITLLSHLTKNAVEVSRGQALSLQVLGEKSVLEISLLVSKQILDMSQIPNASVVASGLLFSPLTQIAMALIQSTISCDELVYYIQYLAAYLHLLHSTRYDQVSQTFNMQLVAFLQIFSSLVAHTHSFLSSQTESAFHASVQNILSDLHICSNIAMDNKLWNLVGRPLMEFSSEAFASFLEILGECASNHFVYQEALLPQSLHASLHQSIVLLTPDERRSLVDAMATLLWMSHTQQSGEGVVTLAQIKEVIEKSLRNSLERLQNTVNVVDTSFNGSVEMEDASTSVVFTQKSAFDLYGTLFHNVVLLNESFKHQASTLSLLLGEFTHSQLEKRYEEELANFVVSPEQLLALRQVSWISTRSESHEELRKQLPAYQLSYLRYYLENYWNDCTIGYSMMQERSDSLDVEALREQFVGSGLMLTPYTAVNVSGAIAPLWNVRGFSVKNSRDRIEQLGVFEKLLSAFFEELPKLGKADELQQEQTILSRLVRLLLDAERDYSAEEVEQILKGQLEQATDVSSMRYESLCLAVIPNVLRLLSLCSGNPFVNTIVVSVCWILLGLLLFNLLLPSSIVDPLLKDFIEGDIVRFMSANLADLAFILQFQSLQLHGSIASSGPNIAAEQESLFVSLLKRNQITLDRLQQGEFKRVCSNSFDQLYSTLYSFGASILSISRVRHLTESLLGHLESCIQREVVKTSDGSTLRGVWDLIQNSMDRLMESPFTVRGDSTATSTSDIATLLKEEQTFHSNNLSFKQSLLRSYLGYRDIVEPIVCSVTQIQHGMRLLATLAKAVPEQSNLSLGNQSLSYLFLSHFAQFPLRIVSVEYQKIGDELVSVMNNELLRETQNKSVIFRSLLTQLLLYNMTVLKRTTTDSAIVEFISHFTDLYNEQKEKEAEERAKAEKAVEFRVRNLNIDNIKGNEEIVEAAFRQQFPDYQLLFDEEAQAKAAAQSVDVEAELQELNRGIRGTGESKEIEENGGIFSSDWKINLDDVGYVCEIVEYLVSAANSREELAYPVREQILFLNSRILLSFEKEIRSLVLTDYEKASSLLTLLELKLGKDVTRGRDLSNLLHPARAYSFHNHSNISEAEYCVNILLPLKRRVFELLKLYPTHVVLQYILRLIDQLFALPIVTPLTVLLSGVEVLSRRVHDWEVSAASMVSLAEHVKQLSGLIIRWRKLELESWGSFLDEEEEKASLKSREYFCQLYSMLLPQNRLNDSIVRSDSMEVVNEFHRICAEIGIRPQDLWPLMASNCRIRSLSGIKQDENDSEERVAVKSGQILSKEVCEYTHSLIDILDSYLRGSQLLEFSSRLHLLSLLSRFMRLQLSQTQLENSMLETNMNILYHTTRLYSVFLPAVKEEITQIKTPIEKQLKDQVKLGKWDDQSYFSLHETVGRIHRQLFKLIYSYRDSNNIKVSVVLDRFLEGELESRDRDEPSLNDKSAKKQQKEEAEKEPIAVKRLASKDLNWDVDPSKFESLTASLSQLEQSLHLEELSSLEKMPVVSHRFAQILNSSSMEYILGEQVPGQSLDELAVTIITTAMELRHETKFVIRKHKEFSHLLSHLKENGFSALRATVPIYQQQYDAVMRLSIPEMRPIPSILKELVPLSGALQQNLALFASSWSKGDQYYYKDYLLLTSLRMQVSREVTDQVTPAEVRRCIGYTENLMLNLIQEREVLLSLSSKLVSLFGTLKHVRCLGNNFQNLNEDAIVVCPAVSEVAGELETLYSSNIEILDELLFFAQQIGSDVKLPDSFVEICSETRKSLQLELEKLTVRDSSLGYQLYCITNSSLYLHAFQVLGENIQRLREAIGAMTDVISIDKLYSAAQHWEATLQRSKNGVAMIEQNAIVVSRASLESGVSTEMEPILTSRNGLVARLLRVVQGLKKLCDKNQNGEEPIGYQGMHEALLHSWSILSLGAIESEFNELIRRVIGSSPASLVSGMFLLKDIVPMMQQLLVSVFDVLLRGVLLNKAMGKLEYVLLKLFKEILKKGFCLPPKQKEEKKQQEEGEEGEAEGTGMGEGEGEKDVTDQLDSKEQLDGLKNEKREEKEEEGEDKDKEAENTGMDVEDDFDGNMEDVKKEEDEGEEDEEEEEEEDERDREMGELDDEDQEVLDEKLWNESEEEEEPNEDEKIEQDAKQQNEKNTDEMMTKEDEDENEKKDNDNENENEKDQEKKENTQEEEMEEMEENDDINDLNEQEYEDDHHMNPKEEEEEEEEDMLPDDMEIEDSGEDENPNPDEMENEIPPEEEEDAEANENQEEEEEEINEEAESIDMQGIGEEEEEEENENEEEAQNGENENPEIDDNQPEEAAEKEETPEKKPNSMATEGIADEAGQDNVLGEESQKKSGQEEEEKKEEMEEEDEEEKKETQRNGELKEGVGNTKEEEEEEKKEEDDENEVNPYKNPEKTQKKWEEEYQRLQMIPQKEKEDENEEGLQQNDPNNQQQQEEQEQEQEKKNLGAEVKQEQSGQDVLAPSLQDVDFKPLTEESNRVEMEVEEEENDEEEEEKEPDEGLQYEKEMNDAMGENAPEFPEDEEALKEAEERKQREEAAAFASDLLDKVTKEGAGKSVDASEPRGIFTKQDLELREAEEEEEVKLPFVEEDSYLNMNVNELLVSAVQDPTVLSRSIGIWKECVASTTDLSNRLSEQLRLLMEPTKASKLTGDFKTGKRINMRKVIPFIASNYRKDKIWLRRSKPSQREYQIMLVIDNSESMKVNNAGEVSFKTLALIGNALSQLEVGQIGVMSFGDNVQYIHPLGTPFTAQSGASALAHFSFAQKTTSFEACLRALIAIMAQSRLRLSGAAKRAVQIAFLVSDGRIQEGRERIARLLRDAEENNILVVLLIIDDTPKAEDSILKTKIYTGKKGHLFANYLENYPFPYYLVVQSVQSLPEILCDALTQWFELINSTHSTN